MLVCERRVAHVGYYDGSSAVDIMRARRSRPAPTIVLKVIPNKVSAESIIKKVSGGKAKFSVSEKLKAVLLLLTFFGIILGNLYFNTASAEIAYKIRDARVELIRLQEANETLRYQIVEESSTENIARRAEAIGMIHKPINSYIDLEKGEVRDSIR